MEISLSSVAVLAPLVIIVPLLWKLLNLVWFRPKKLERCLRQQGLSGDPHGLFLGKSKEGTKKLIETLSKPINFSDDIVPRVSFGLHDCIQKHGKNSFTWMGLAPSLLVTSPDQIKYVLNNTKEFQKPPTSNFTKYLAPGIFNLDGDKWVTHRKILNSAFHMEKLKKMMHAFCLSCNEMIIQKWESLVSAEGSCELDIWPYLQVLTSDVISRTAFGSNYDEGTRIFALIKEQAELFVKAMGGLHIITAFLPTKLSKRMKEVDKEVTFLLKEIINKRIRKMEIGEASDDDLLGIMLESNAKEIENKDKNIRLSIQDIIEECKLFYFAGQETVSSLLLWTMILLSKHQEWQARARDEVLQVFRKEKLEFDDLSRLKIVTMILHEVLRLYPPAVAVIRAVKKDTKLGKLLLPAGVLLTLPVVLVHHDRELWGDDVKEFKPERFSEGVSKATNGQASFIPFGGGPRICIGQNFALIEAKIALAMILKHFTFELSPSYAHAPFAVLTIQPQLGAHIILRKL